MLGNQIISYGIQNVLFGISTMGLLEIKEVNKEKLVVCDGLETYTYINKKYVVGESKYSGEDKDIYKLLRSIGWGHSGNEQLIVFGEDKVYEYTTLGQLYGTYKYEYIGERTIAIEYEGKTEYVTIEEISEEEIVFGVNGKKIEYPAKKFLYR